MITITIDGVGRVKVSDGFKDLSPEEQAEEVDFIVEEYRRQQGRSDSTMGGAIRGFTDSALGLADSALAGVQHLGRFAQEGIAGPVEEGDWSWADTIKSLRNPVQGARESLNYHPTTSWEDLKSDPNISNFLGFAVEGGAQALPHILGSYAKLPVYAGALVGGYAEETAQNQGREADDVTLGDFGRGAATAGSSAVLERLGARGIIDGVPGASSVLGRVAGAAKREAQTELGQEAIHHVGTRAGTERGMDAGEFLDNAAAGAVMGAGYGGLMRGTQEARPVVSDTYRRGVDAVRTSRAASEYSKNPAQFASDLRVAELFESRAATESAFESGKSTSADEVFKSITVDLERQLKGLADDIYNAGDITKADRDAIKDAVTRAKRHNYELGQSGKDSGYFDTEIDTVMSIDMPAPAKEALQMGLRDLNTSAFNAFKKNRTGPFQRLAESMGGATASVGAIAGTPFGPAGMATGAALGRAGLVGAGRMIDRIGGYQEPPILRRLDARREALKRQDVDYGNTVESITSSRRDAQERTPLVTDPKESTVSQSPVDSWLKEQGIARGGGWKRQIQSYLNTNLLPGDKAITQAEIDGYIQEMRDSGGLTPEQAQILLDTPSGRITDSSIFYGIQDYIAARLGHDYDAPENRGGDTKQQKQQRQETQEPEANTPSWLPEGRSTAGNQRIPIDNPLAYEQTMRNVRAATDTAMETAPTALLQANVAEIANARTRTEKRELYERLLEAHPEHRPWLEQVVRPLTEFGPQDS